MHRGIVRRFQPECLSHVHLDFPPHTPSGITGPAAGSTISESADYCYGVPRAQDPDDPNDLGFPVSEVGVHA